MITTDCLFINLEYKQIYYTINTGISRRFCGPYNLEAGLEITLDVKSCEVWNCVFPANAVVNSREMITKYS